MKSRLWQLCRAAVVVPFLFGHSSHSAERISDLAKNFAQPPPSARPWIFWFWLNGNISSNGITADLEAMKRAGLGGVVIMEVDQGTPKGPLAFGSPEWYATFKHMCAEANRLGLGVSMNNDAGWCGSGGPWITPELSMQKIVWSETNVSGPGHFEATLPLPNTNLDYYRDVALFAVPTPPGEEGTLASAKPRVTTSLSDSDLDFAKLFDGNPETLIQFPRPLPERPQFIQFEFSRPFSARRFKMVAPSLTSHKTCHGEIQISDDGQKFRTICEFDAEAGTLSVSFTNAASRFFRIRFPKSDQYIEHLTIAEVELSPDFRIDQIESKALFVAKKDEDTGHTNAPPTTGYQAIASSQLVNLTSRLRDGALKWELPPGNWTLLRFGHTSTAETNNPAPETGRGLECDKLSKEAANAAFDGLMGKLVKTVGPLAGKSLVGTHIDSWEVASQNWTPKFPEEFRRRRGYDMLRFLPVVTGRVVDNLEVSERFLWDLRQTISDLVIENYAGHFNTLANRHGLRLTMEAYDWNPSDDLTMAGQVDEPVTEFWGWPAYGVGYSCIEMTSAAHVYGKRIIGAEAFTATDAEKWLGHPFNSKVFGDWAFCHGINRFYIHRYAHQPWTNPDRSPGMSMGPWGLHYERTQTWWDQINAWHDYLTRCQFLLQLGRSVADICYLAAEEAPQKWEAPGRPRERSGYNFDGCPPDALLKRMSVKDGMLVLPDGMTYRMLVLAETNQMTPRLLAKIKALVKAGATVVGPKPVKSPSLSDYPRCDEHVRRLADELWADCDGKSVKEHRFGKGRIIWGKTPQEIFAADGVLPDFTATTKSLHGMIRYTHRVVDDADIYFLASKSPQPEEAVCAFRIRDRQPEFWRPDTGRIERPAVYDEIDGTLRLPIRFEPNGSVFVVFRSKAKREPDRIVSLTRNNDALAKMEFHPQRPARTNQYETVVDTFTMAVWAKPQVEIDLPPEEKSGIAGIHHFRNEALFPPPGHEVYSDPTHAGSGLSIGRNGVCVLEHGNHHIPFPLVFAAPLTNWTHVAVVYRNGKPSLYLNGKFAHEGLPSEYRVHPGAGVKHNRGIGPFWGAIGEFETIERALDEAQIAELMKSMPIPEEPAANPNIELTRREDGAIIARIWTAGSYVAKTAQGTEMQWNVSSLPESVDLSGPWELRFAKGWGAPEQARFDQLVSWSDHPDSGIKYFSGTATYRKTFRAPGKLLDKDNRFYLDLGKVAVIAQVTLNGHNLGTLWKPPFQIDVSDVLKDENLLEVKVTNLWPNRMIGDEQLPEDSSRKENGTLQEWPLWLQNGEPSPAGRYAFTSWRLWKKDSPLQQSGLIGPVSLKSVKEFSSGGR